MNEITPLGDSALVVRVADDFEDAPEKTLARVLQVIHQIDEADIPGVVELAPAYTTVAVFVDPLRAIAAGAPTESALDWLSDRIRTTLSERAGRPSLPASTPVEIPICYDADFAFDLADVARQTRRTPAEVIELHCRAEYLVNFVGFTPGFPYLSGLPNELNVPRRSSPRKDVPAGSVAIGGKQTGIYPVNSPGGWNVIGRTPLRIFDPAKEPPALLRPGDRVRFRTVSREEYESTSRCSS